MNKEVLGTDWEWTFEITIPCMVDWTIHGVSGHDGNESTVPTLGHDSETKPNSWSTNLSVDVEVRVDVPV